MRHGRAVYGAQSPAGRDQARSRTAPSPDPDIEPSAREVGAARAAIEFATAVRPVVSRTWPGAHVHRRSVPGPTATSPRRGHGSSGRPRRQSPEAFARDRRRDGASRTIVIGSVVRWPRAGRPSPVSAAGTHAEHGRREQRSRASVVGRPGDAQTRWRGMRSCQVALEEALAVEVDLEVDGEVEGVDVAGLEAVGADLDRASYRRPLQPR